MVVNIREIQQFDLQNPSESIDYLCYLTEDKYSLVNITLINDPDSRLLSNFQEDFMIEKRETYKYLLCYHYSHNLYYTFINSTNKFIFNDYFFNNLKSTDPEKKSRLNLLLNNIENLLKEILVNTEKNNLDISNYRDINELEKEFEIKFKSTFVISQDYNSHPLKVYNYPFNLLLFCLGISLKKIYDKLRLEYSGYLKNPSSTTYQPSSSSKNQTNNFFSSEKPYNSNFEMLWSQHHGHSQIKLQKKLPNWQLVFFEILNGNIIVEKNTDGAGTFLCKYIDEEFNSPTKLGEKVAEVLLHEKNTIRPILTDTISKTGLKQIFTKGHKNVIQTILKQYDNKMCTFFQKQLDDLD